MDGFFQDNDNGMTPKEKKRLYIGLFIFIVLFMSLIVYLDKSQFMKKLPKWKAFLIIVLTLITGLGMVYEAYIRMANA